MACTTCTDECNCRMIDVTGTKACDNYDDLVQEYVTSLSCTIKEINVCSFNGMKDLLSNVIQAISCVFKNTAKWLCKLQKRNVLVDDTNTVDLTKTGDWLAGDDNIHIKADAKISKRGGNRLQALSDGLYASVADQNGYEPVSVSYSHAVPWSHFQIMNDDGGTRSYFSGAAGNEDFFTVPKGDMDIVDAFLLQTKVTGNFVVMKSADVQTAIDMGSYFKVNIDVYLYSSDANFTNASDNTIYVDAIAIGRKKVY